MIGYSLANFYNEWSDRAGMAVKMTGNPYDEDWPTNGAPDAVSAGQAARVQMEMINQHKYTAVSYLMHKYGDTQEQAMAIVENCHAGEE
jgi:hypothetical protein